MISDIIRISKSGAISTFMWNIGRRREELEASSLTIWTTRIRKKCLPSSRMHVALSSVATCPSSRNGRYLYVLEMAADHRICRIPYKRRIGNKSDEDDTS